MSWKSVTFQPLDTLFFRDGRPYHLGESTQFNLKSMFPPSPKTLVGAIRSAYAHTLGWEGQYDWSDDIKQHLGDRDKLNPLKFQGPFIIYNKEQIFPVPYCILGKSDNPENDLKLSHISYTAPSDPFHCDLGNNIALPSIQDASVEGLKTLDDWYIKVPAFKKYLKYDKLEPNDFIHKSQLWKTESRLGIQRDDSSRNTTEGGIYSPSHIRLNETVSQTVMLAMLADGLPDISFNNHIAPLGGESRACFIEVKSCHPTFGLPEFQDFDPSQSPIRYTVTALTPINLDTLPQPNEPFLNLPGTFISACIPRPIRLGGWDGVDKKPLPLKPYIAPGSVFFLETESHNVDQIKPFHNTQIGIETEWGFGLIAIGQWKKEKHS